MTSLLHSIYHSVAKLGVTCPCQGRGGEGRGGEGRGRGGMTAIHVLIGMFNSNPMIPQYLNNNLT